jgi:tRNA threonylcarbamoyladenosine biosynthesis protein TsaB
MLILAVDTGTQSGSLAILKDVRVLGEVCAWTDETYSSRMFRHLEFLLRELALDLKQIDVFAVAAGPGSFTGLRVGLTAIKGWSEVYGKPIAAVSGLEAIAASSRHSAGLLAPVLDARRGQIYGGLYQQEGTQLKIRGNAVVLSPEEYVAWVRREVGGAPVHFVSPTPEVLEGVLGKSGPGGEQVEEVTTVLAPMIGRLGYARAQCGELVDALTLDANYVRHTDAELHLKESA